MPNPVTVILKDEDGVDHAYTATNGVRINKQGGGTQDFYLTEGTALLTDTTSVDVRDKANAQIDAANVANLSAGNIKKDVSILGVTGSYEGSGGTDTVTSSIYLSPDAPPYDVLNYMVWVKSLPISKMLIRSNSYERSAETLSASLVGTTPQILYDTAYSQVNKKVYMFGGRYGNVTATSSIFVFDMDTETFSVDNATMPIGIMESGAVTVDGKVYIIGGRNSSSAFQSTIYVFDPIQDSVSIFGASMPTPIGVPKCISVGKDIYAFGGNTSSGASDKIYKISTENNTVTQLQATLKVPVFGHTVFASYDSKWIYIIGGFTSDTSSSVPKQSVIQAFNTSNESIKYTNLYYPSLANKNAAVFDDGMVFLPNDSHTLGSVWLFEDRELFVYTNSVTISNPNLAVIGVTGMKAYFISGSSTSNITKIERRYVINHDRYTVATASNAISGYGSANHSLRVNFGDAGDILCDVRSVYIPTSSYLGSYAKIAKAYYYDTSLRTWIQFCGERDPYDSSSALYENVSYITCSGASYFSTTFKLSSDDVIRFKVSGTGGICGCYSNGYANNNRAVQVVSATTYWKFGNNELRGPSISGGSYPTDVVWKNGEIFFNDELVANHTEGSFSSSSYFYVGAMNSSSTKFSGSIYYIEIKGKAVFIPVMRKSDNVYGMYESYSGTFYTSESDPFSGPS